MSELKKQLAAIDRIRAEVHGFRPLSRSRVEVCITVSWVDAQRMPIGSRWTMTPRDTDTDTGGMG